MNSQPLFQDAKDLSMDRGEPHERQGASALSPGLVLNECYRIQERIGKGGMGVVFAAEHLRLGRKVAIKTVRAEHAHDAEFHRRLLKEARIGASLNHENIVQILDVDVTVSGLPYFVLEFVDGQTLAELLAEEVSLPVSRAVSIMFQTARAVACAHALGIVHRDLKPHNIMVQTRSDGSEHVKILDFGIAKQQVLAEGSDATLTQSSMGAGTPHYMAPEVARGETNGQCGADVYALGAILYEMLSGFRLHEGGSRNAVVYSVISKSPQGLNELVEDLPVELAALVEEALCRDPQGRPDADDVARRLHECLRKTSSEGLPAKSETKQNEKSGGRGKVFSVVLTGLGLALAFAMGHQLAVSRSVPLHNKVPTAEAAPKVLPPPPSTSQVAHSQRSAPTNAPLANTETPRLPLKPKTISQEPNSSGSAPTRRLTSSAPQRPSTKTKTGGVPAPSEVASLPETINFEAENPY